MPRMSDWLTEVPVRDGTALHIELRQWARPVSAERPISGQVARWRGRLRLPQFADVDVVEKLGRVAKLAVRLAGQPTAEVLPSTVAALEGVRNAWLEFCEETLHLPGP